MAFNHKLAAKKERLIKRAAIIQAIRQYFIKEGYLEVETPLLLSEIAPEAHIDPVQVGDMYLQTSPELCMKRMVAAGYDKIFQISHCWRDGERGTRHLPEFTMLEWYRTESDYTSLMSETEALIRYVSQAVFSSEEIIYGGERVDLSGTWERLSVNEAYERFSDIGLQRALEDDRFDNIMVEQIEPNLGLGRPTFLYDYPASLAALAKLKDEDDTVAERFELYISGIELANGFSELTDPAEQRIRFSKERIFRVSIRKVAPPIPEVFLDELENMPATAGIALGIDRLVMLMSDTEIIDKVVAF